MGFYFLKFRVGCLKYIIGFVVYLVFGFVIWYVLLWTIWILSYQYFFTSNCTDNGVCSVNAYFRAGQQRPLCRGGCCSERKRATADAFHSRAYCTQWDTRWDVGLINGWRWCESNVMDFYNSRVASAHLDSFLPDSVDMSRKEQFSLCVPPVPQSFLVEPCINQ